MLLTRSPLRTIANSPFDLHVLSTPPAFILSQDQTLRINILYAHLSVLELHVFLSLSRIHRSSTFYHSSVVKVLRSLTGHSLAFTKRAGFYQPASALCQGILLQMSN